MSARVKEFGAIKIELLSWLEREDHVTAVHWTGVAPFSARQATNMRRHLGTVAFPRFVE
jgi:hypothetical protein